MSELNGTLTSSVNLVGSFGGAGTGTSDYNELSNKPSINGVELSGNKTGAQLNLVSDSDLATVATTGNYNDLLHKPVIPAAQVNSDWNSTSGVSAILNKPDIPAAQVNSDWNSDSGVSEILNKPTLSAVATSGDYDDLTNKPTIPAAQVNSDWNSDSGVSEILNKPTLSAVATSGDYDDLTNTPTIPVNSDFALSGLSDTDITTPTQPNQVLAYDSNGKVVNKTLGELNGVTYFSGEINFHNYITTGYVTGSGNYVDISFPIYTNATSGSITQIGTGSSIFINGNRTFNPFTVSGSTVSDIGQTFITIELKLSTSQTASSTCTVLLQNTKITLT